MRGDVRGVRRPISARPVSGAENCAHVTADSISTPWAPALHRGCGVDAERKSRGGEARECDSKVEKKETEAKRDKATMVELWEKP